MQYSIYLLSLFTACSTTEVDNQDTIDSEQTSADADATDTPTPEDYAAGCFVLDDGYGFASINDAMLFAESSSKIVMQDCASEHEEAIVIEKSITIEGPEDGSWTLIAPSNEHGIKIQATDVSISNVNIVTTRSGVVIENSENINLSNISVVAGGNWGLKSIDTMDLTVSLSNFSENGYGGVLITDGTAKIESTTLLTNVSVGLKVTEWAKVELEDVTANDNYAANMTEPEDGYGVWASDNAAVYSTNGTYNANFLMGIRGENADLYLTGDTVSNSLAAGVWSDPGITDLVLTDVTIENNVNYGIISQNTEYTSLSGVNISVLPENTPSLHPDEWQDAGLVSTGIYTGVNALHIENSTISGYNNSGVYAVSDSDASIEVDGLTIDNVRRLGVILAGYNGNIRQLKVENLGLPDAQPEGAANYERCLTVGTYANLMLNDSTINLYDSVLSNSEIYGLVALDATVNIDNLFSENNFCSGVMSFRAATDITNSHFEEPSGINGNLGASVISYESSFFRITNSEFKPETNPPISDPSYIGDQHVWITSTAVSEIENNTFYGAEYAINSSATSNTIKNNSFIDQNPYAYSIIFSYSQDTTDSIDKKQQLEGNYFTGAQSGGSAIYCYFGGEVELEDDQFVDFTSGYTLYTSNCSTKIEDAIFDNVSGSTILAYDGNHEWDGVEILNSGSSAYSSAMAQFYAFDAPMNLSITDTHFSQFGSESNAIGAINLTTFDTTNSPIQFYFDDLFIEPVRSSYSYSIQDSAIYISGATGDINNSVISTSNRDGIYLSSATLNMSSTNINFSEASAINANSSQVTLDTVNLANNQSNGISLNGGSVNITSSNILDSGMVTNASAILVNSGNMEADNLQINRSGMYGIEVASLQTSTISLSNSSIIGCAQSGLYLRQTNASLTSNSITHNLGYAVECSTSLVDAGTVSASCQDNTVSPNQLGDMYGCENVCEL